MDALFSNENSLSDVLPDAFMKYFWEYRGMQLNLKDDSRLIAERILNFGNPEAVKWLLSHVSTTFLKQLIVHSRNLDNKTRNYWNIILNE